MAKALRVLSVEDSEDDYIFLVRELERQGFEVQACRVQTSLAMQSALTEQTWDVVLADYMLPEFSASRALKLLQERRLDLPFIVVSGAIGENLAVSMVKAGAHDYLMKDRLHRLGMVIEREIEEAQRRKADLRNRAKIDRLNHVLEALRRVHQLIIREKCPQTLLSKVAASLIETRGYACAQLIRTNDSCIEQISKGNTDGCEIEVKKKIDQHDVPACIAKALVQESNVAVHDAMSSSSCVSSLDRDHQQCIWIRLSHEKRIYGLMCVAVPKGEPISQDEISFLKGIAGDLAFALSGIETNAKLKTETALTEAALEAMGDIFGVFDPRTSRLLRWNKALNETIEYDDHMIGSVAFPKEIVEEAYRDHITSAINEAMEGKRSQAAFEVRAKSGKKVLLEFVFTIISDNNQSPPLLAAIGRNLDERKKAERKVRFLSEVVEQTPDGIVCTDKKFRITYMNRAAENLLGWTIDEIRGQNPMLFSEDPNDRSLQRELETKITQGKVFEGEIKTRRRDGNVLYCQCKIAPIFDKQGDTIAYMAAQRDITRQKEMETQLGLSRKLEAVGQLAAGIAHEINTPSQFVSDSIQFIKEASDETRTLIKAYHQAMDTICHNERFEKIRKQIQEAEEIADLEYFDEHVPKAFERCFEGLSRISAIVGAMKEFAHPDRNEKSPADLNQALLTTLTIAKNEYKYVAEVETELEPLPPVVCHVGDLNQVFLNLIVNAAHAIADIVGDTDNKGKIKIRTAHKNEAVCIEIEDTGCGIPIDIRDRIFDPFFTTKEVGKGSGQGLAIARAIIVDKHNGLLMCTSAEGRGTTFRICLPINGQALSKNNSLCTNQSGVSVYNKSSDPTARI